MFALLAGFAPPPGFVPPGAPRKSLSLSNSPFFLQLTPLILAGAFQPPPGFQPPGQGRGYPPPGFGGR